VGSYGGVEYDMFALYDAIKAIHAPIHTTAIGKCMSAAPLLVCAGKKGHRYAAPNTFFMVHQGWDDIGVKRYDELKSDMALFETINQRWCTLMAKHTIQTARFWHEQCEKVGDLYFGAEQAKAWGMVDHVWPIK
jgi:ATP-dependent Clp protease protease subunit